MSAITVQQDALLATTAADVTIEALNERLERDGLCLPLFPLEHGLTLAELVRRNAGGWRQLAYGTIARYIRAATVQPPHPLHAPLLRLGGPTLKRATGYALQRAWVGSLTPEHLLPPLRDMALHDITLNIRPLPPARRELFIVCEGMVAACHLAARLLATGAALSALMVMDDACLRLAKRAPFRAAADTVLLAELQGIPPVLERQQQQLVALVEQAGAFLAEAQHDGWEETWDAMVAARNRTAPPVARLDLLLPHAALPAFIEQAHTLAQRYGADIAVWGDAGVGLLALTLLPRNAAKPLSEGEQRQLAALLYAAARQAGGSLATEYGNAHPHLTRAVALPTEGAAVPPAPSTPAHLLDAVRDVVGASWLITRPDDLLCYAEDASIARAEGLPLAAVLPASTAEVCAVMHLAAEAGIPITTRGAGSGLAGGATPTQHGLLLVLTRMQRLSIDTTQRVAHVEAGVVTTALQQAAAAHHLAYLPDPSSLTVSTIGGNIACNAGGPRCLKYGVTGDYVLGMKAVCADGSLLTLNDGIAAQSSDAGIMHMLIGSEGTLAVITEATLRLLPPPATRRTTLAIFTHLDDACATVEAIMAAGLLPASLELLDDTTIRVVEAYLHLGLPNDAGALLLLLADGEPEAVEWESEQLAALARRGGARLVQVAQNAEDEAALWRARRSISPALARVLPNKMGEDLCVPVPQVAATVRRIKAIAAEQDLPIPVFGHAGDGNLHPNILFDKRDTAETARAWQAAEAIFEAALDAGGTLSGEHGIGTLKRPFMAAALGAEVLEIQRAIKARLDPYGILNPGKVV
jgi:glycolate oxidase subunit GlcD